MKRFLKILPALAALTLWAGCIKEDRSDCPCLLFLDFSDVDTSVVTSVNLLMTSDEGFEFSDEVSSGQFSDYMVKVPARQIRLYMLAGAGHCLAHDMSVAIPLGEECPELFVHESIVNTYGELVKERVWMRKNHCVLTVQVEAGEDYPFKLTVRGKVNGYNSDSKPVIGEFSCPAIPDELGKCEVVIPRQLDSSLVLDVDDGTGTVKTFAIGESIVAGGYDWKAENLDDVTVKLDYSLTQIALEIVEWAEESMHEVVI